MGSKRANATRRRHPSTVFPDLTVNTISEKEKSKAELTLTTMEQTDIQSSISTAKARRDLVMGLKETVRLVAAGQAELVVLASDVDSKEILGTWCGLSKIDEEGEVVKARACGCVGLKSIPNNDAGNKVKAFIQTNQA